MSAILFKTPRLLREWPHIAPPLLEIALWLAEHWPGETLAVDSIYRTLEENAAVGAETEIHCQLPHRAIDFSVHNVEQVAVDGLVELLNSLWIYDSTRPALPVAYGKPHGTGPHLHVQVHENTRLRSVS